MTATGEMPEDVLRIAIAAWLTRYLADVLGLDRESIDERQVFTRYGLDSAAAIAMSSDLGEWLGCEVDAAAAYDHPSIARLAAALAADRMIRVAAKDQAARLASAAR
jgi:acyl carrier protein